MRRLMAAAVAVGVLVWLCGLTGGRRVAEPASLGWAAMVGGGVGLLLGLSWSRSQRGWHDWRELAAKKRTAGRALPGLFGNTAVRVLLAVAVGVVAVALVVRAS